MGKLIVLGVLAVFAWWMWRRLQQPENRRDGRQPLAQPAESMAACRHCGLNQPRSECIESHGSFYCCEAHRQASESGMPPAEMR